jgi:hypothetical protein
MTFEDFYNFSKKLNQLVEVAKVASKTHFYLVSVLADGSQRGMDCTYARASAKLSIMEDASFLEYLKDNIDILSPELVSELESLFEATASSPK